MTSYCQYDQCSPSPHIICEQMKQSNAFDVKIKASHFSLPPLFFFSLQPPLPLSYNLTIIILFFSLPILYCSLFEAGRLLTTHLFLFDGLCGANLTNFSSLLQTSRKYPTNHTTINCMRIACYCWDVLLFGAAHM